MQCTESRPITPDPRPVHFPGPHSVPCALGVGGMLRPSATDRPEDGVWLLSSAAVNPV